jgi:hypothetical protein
MPAGRLRSLPARRGRPPAGIGRATPRRSDQTTVPGGISAFLGTMMMPFRMQ